MPTARIGLSTCVADGKIYAMGGCRNPYDSSEFATVEAYDPATDTWTIMAEMQFRRKALASASVNGKIYGIGGQPVAGWNAPLSTVEEYDPRPAVSVLRTGSLLRVYWNGILESSDALDATNWQSLNPPRQPYVVNPFVAPVKFYRAREP